MRTTVGRIGIGCVLAGTVVLGGCGHSTAKATRPSASKPSGSTTTASAGATSTSTGTPATTAPPVSVTVTSVPATARGCTSAQIATTASDDSGMGHIGVVLIFRNSSAQTCRLEGYPGAAALDAAGHQDVQATRTLNGYWRALPPGEGPPTVTLVPGGTASAFIEGTDVPVNGATSCPTYPNLLVTPPNTTVSVLVAKSMPGCTPIQIHPVVPGITGTIVH